jgi:hypothetical protein
MIFFLLKEERTLKTKKNTLFLHLVNMVIVHQMFLQIIKLDAASFILILTS